MYNLVRKHLPAYTWTTVILLCKVVTGQREVKLGPCDDDRVFEVFNNTAGQNLTLDVRTPEFDFAILHWTLRPAIGQNIYVGSCDIDIISGGCSTNYPGVLNLSAIVINSRFGFSSTLTISAVERGYNLSGSYFDNGTALFGNSSVLVYGDIFPRLSPREIFNCTTDFVDVAQSLDCTISYNTSSTPWSVHGRCDVIKVYSALGRYKCQLMVQTVGEPLALGNYSLMTTHYVGNGPYVNGYCTMTSELPVTSGNYTYFVELTPGKKKYGVNFMGRPEISRPLSAILEHDCPSYITEGHDVSCTCRSTQNVLGSPQGYVQWVTSGSERLSLSRVQRNSSVVQSHLCRLVWNGQVIKSTIYTIDVWWRPSWSRHNCPASVREGDNVTCSCDLSDVGHPPATVHWQQTGSASLALTSLSRHDNGRSFACLVVWNGSEFDSATYRLSVQYKPSTVSLSHNCPPYVTEGSALDCSCVASDAGNPPATLSWGGPMMTSPSDHLLGHDMQSDDDGTTMTCRMTWDGVLITSVNYTVLVVPDARAALARGVGIGLGVGVALIAIGAAVLVLVLWRRGWELVLPCSKKRETTRTDRKAGLGFKRPFVFKKRTKSDQLNTEAQASAYEVVDASMIGVANTYESLRVDPASAVSRKKKKGTKKRGGPSHDNTAIKLDFHPGSSGAKAYKNVTTSRDKSKGERKRTADSDASVYVIP